ncbi:MAG: hypothetical protein PVH03_00895 [Chloroflexota bacterium]
MARLIGTTIVGVAGAVILSFIIDNDLLLSLIMGFLVGIAGLGSRKLLLGLAVGLAVGLLAGLFIADPNAAIIGGAVVLLNRFYFGRNNFLTLYYSIERISPAL